MSEKRLSRSEEDKREPSYAELPIGIPAKIHVIDGRQYIVCSRRSARSIIKTFAESIRNGEKPPFEIAGLLNVGDKDVDLAEGGMVVDAKMKSLVGRGYLDSVDNPSHKKLVSAGINKCTALGALEARATALEAMMFTNTAFIEKPKGVMIIFCEHGLHRSPAYLFNAIIGHITLGTVGDHSRRSRPMSIDEANRLVRKTRSSLWRVIERGFRAEDGVDGVRPNKRIMDVSTKVAIRLWNGALANGVQGLQDVIQRINNLQPVDGEAKCCRPDSLQIAKTQGAAPIPAAALEVFK
jgi:hypothetical protein